MTQIELDNMPFQDLTAYGEKLFPLDITTTEKSFDCLLGYEFFKKYTVCLDLKNRKVGLSRAGFWDYIF